MAAGAFSLVFVALYIFSAGSVEVKKFATGSTQTLSVNAQRDLKFIEWKHNGNLVVEWYGKGDPTQYRYRDHAKLNTNNGELTIKMLKDYSGEYKCQYLYTDVGTFEEKIFQVEVIDPVSKPKVTCKKKFTDITLKCTADSSEHVNFKWKGPDDFSHVGDSVHITNPETKDSYFCTATNEVSEETAEFKLTDCPSQGSVEVKKFATGSTQTLSVNAERALKLIEWKHNGNLVVEWYGVGDPTQYRYHDHAKLNTNTGDLTIKMLKDYSGEYKCQYQYTDVDDFQEKIFQVEVIDPVSKPKVTCKKKFTDITLKCTADSSEHVNFKWKGPDDFSHVGDSVHITNPETKDSYFCTATNEVSEETAEFKLTDCPSQGSVEVKKFATGSTQTLSVNAERALKLIEWKHNGNLVVEWYGKGDPTQYRYHDHAKLNTNTGDLTIKMLKDYSGEYKCQYQYTDVDDFQEKIFQVEVIDPVSKPKVTCKKKFTDITLKCTADSSEHVNFKWKGPDDFSHVGDSVHITNPETKDSYFCTATNEVSEETAEFKLTDCPSQGSVEVKKFATGSTQTLSVNAERALKLIEWKHNGNLVVEWYGVGDPTQYRYHDHAKLNTNTGDLTIKMLKDYSGEYKCQYQYTDVDDFQEKIFQVEVIDPVSKPKVTCKKKFTDITLKCTADSSEHVNFKWKGPDDFSHVGDSVHITNPETKDSYFCTATNEVSEETAEFKLTDCPSQGSVEVKKFATGSTQTLSVNAERALKLIEWKHNGNLVVEWYGKGDPTQYRYHDHAKLNTNTGDLTIKMLKDYSGEYKCQYIYTDVDDFQEKIFQVEVIDPVSKPNVTCEKNGTNITLKCTMDSSAQANFKWKGPDDFSHVGESVHITNPETKDLYFCTATNEVSEETAEFELTGCPRQDHQTEAED